MEIGDRIKALRELRGMTQGDSRPRRTRSASGSIKRSPATLPTMRVTLAFRN